MNILTIGNLKKSCNIMSAYSEMLMVTGLAVILIISGILITKQNHGKA